MEFCPKCCTLLVPAKVGRSKKLICPRCGYKGRVKTASSYKISEKCREPREVAIIVESKKKKKKPQREQEFELEPPEIEEEEELYTGE